MNAYFTWRFDVLCFSGSPNEVSVRLTHSRGAFAEKFIDGAVMSAFLRRMAGHLHAHSNPIKFKFFCDAITARLV